MSRISNWIGNEVGILTPYHRKVALKFPEISISQKVTISGVSYIIYLYKGESKTFSSKINRVLSIICRFNVGYCKCRIKHHLAEIETKPLLPVDIRETTGRCETL